jgi:hypothetical protein
MTLLLPSEPDTSVHIHHSASGEDAVSKNKPEAPFHSIKRLFPAARLTRMDRDRWIS